MGRPKGSGNKKAERAQSLNNNFYYWLKGLTNYYVNPDSVTVDTYEKMVNTDETVGFGIDFLTLASLIQMGEYTHPNKKIQKFINENFELMEGNIMLAVEEMVATSLWAGHSTTENIWDQRKGKVVLKDLQTLHPSTITYELNMDGPRKNKLKRVVQYFRNMYEKEIEPATKRIVLTYKKRFGNYYGNSILKRAFKNWFIKEEMLKAWAKALSRHACPFPLIKSGNLAAELELEDGRIMSNREYLDLVISQMYSGNGLLVDSDTEVEIKETSKNISIDFEKIILYCNKMIFRAMLIPSLVADAERAGSYALGKKHFQVFLLVTNNLIKYVTENLLEQLVRPLIEWNFPGVTEFGSWQIESIDGEDANIFATVLEKATQNGYLDSQDLDDLNGVRAKLGFPPKEKVFPLKEVVNNMIAGAVSAGPMKPEPAVEKNIEKNKTSDSAQSVSQEKKKPVAAKVSARKGEDSLT